MGTSVAEIPCPKRRKIKETVLNILKNADLEADSECSVREAAAQKLGMDLSDMDNKSFITKVVESFLFSLAAAETLENGGGGNQEVGESRGGPVGEEQQQLESRLSNGSPDVTDSNSRVICKLSDKRSVAIHNFRGQNLVSICDYHQKDGKQFPSGRGISLTAKQWSYFRNKFSAIEEAIAKMESQKGLVVVEKQSAANILSSVDDITLQGPVATNQNQMETDSLNSADPVNPQRRNIKIKHEVLDSVDPMTIPSSADQMASERHQLQAVCSTSFSAFGPPGNIRHNHLVNFPKQSLVPIMTTRLNGKNYHCWMHQMEFFLKQLNIAYVLSCPCPSIPMEGTSIEENLQAKAAAQKWADDEYICRHSILNSLSDNLFDQYSKKVCSAKELWEELKSVYDDDFGTKRSQVNKYIQFEMVDGVSVIEQVQELNQIANSIMASGVWMDENFHVSVIVSKLPPSWREFRAKLMHEEFLPLNMLIHRVKVEEESHTRYKKENCSKNANVINTKAENKAGPRKADVKKCYTCGKEGHISKYCRDRHFEVRGKSNLKDNGARPTVADINMDQRTLD